MVAPSFPHLISRRSALRAALLAFGTLGASVLVAACGGTATVSGGASNAAASAPSSTAAASAPGTTVGAVASTAATSAAAAASQAASAANAPASGPVTITANIPSFLQKPTEAAVKGFSTQFPNVTLNLVYVPGTQFDEKVDLQVSSGDAPAIWWPGAQRGYRYYAARNLLLPLSPYVATDKYDLSVFYKPLTDFFTWQGQLYAMPSDAAQQILYYRKDLFDSAGAKPPSKDWADSGWTWSDFAAAAQKVLKRQGSKTQVWGLDTPYNQRNYPYMFGGSYTDKSGWADGQPKKAAIDSPTGVQTFTYIQDLIYKDKVQPQPAESQSMRSGGVTNLFAAGQVAMTISDLSLGKLLQQGVNFTWGVGVYPKGPQSDRVAPLYPDGWSAFKATKHPDVAWSLLKYVSSKDQNLAYMNALGWAPMRKDIVDEYAKATGAAAGFSADDFSKVYMGQMDHVQISETHAILQWSQLWSTTISPTQDALLLNHSSPKDAATKMQSGIDAILAQPNQLG